ncbi:hypothetical protein B566_EDAN002251 [Ephemera danica]|nr:hypothetical protein B566_EDAN002251 [Ephemera danica]
MKVFLVLSVVCTAVLASPSEQRCGETACTTTAPKPVVRCPDCVNSNCVWGAMFVPYPGDCNKYCVCDPQGAIFMSCPEGLVFDPSLNVCVWPASFNCKNSDPYPGCEVPDTPTTTKPPTTQTTTCPNTPPPPTTTHCPAATTKPPCGTEAPSPIEYCPECVNDQCTLDMCNLAKGVNYPGDCTRFCMCTSTGAVAMDCPEGLVFEVSLGVCVWPAESNCKNSDVIPGC